ncbi:conserved hypothetical protein [Verticillium alfalfae VaMs.102]|uniref:LYC1 C-terminal domain-containing protein n=1 Tax=Verticillium alfalfae (strain VaMs.102 / ATCC MYA-4576 / FGSC 10136) TaxID=526221 RepID=C9S5L7_VERA1|nr:conserved hypothetical protein [Verticillium alfalfae VaMs.102]EEY15081.1 conserved hypothetical protein [Verticillium alfalfae VaMs.102]
MGSHAEAPELALAIPTPDERTATWTATHPHWGAALDLDVYHRREHFLTTVPQSRNGGITHWILTDPSAGPGARPVLSSCESIRKRCLVASPDGTVREGVTHGIASTPSIRGAVFGAPGNRVWAVWTRGYYGGLKKPEGNTFHILRVSIEDEDAADEAYLAEAMGAILGLAREEAAAWKVNNVELWNPTAKLRAAIDRAGLPHEFVDRQDTSIACLMWYGDGEVDWVANEKFGWC